jgi:hypothetical protein
MILKKIIQMQRFVLCERNFDINLKIFTFSHELFDTFLLLVNLKFLITNEISEDDVDLCRVNMILKYEFDNGENALSFSQQQKSSMNYGKPKSKKTPMQRMKVNGIQKEKSNFLHNPIKEKRGV